MPLEKQHHDCVEHIGSSFAFCLPMQTGVASDRGTHLFPAMPTSTVFFVNAIVLFCFRVSLHLEL